MNNIYPNAEDVVVIIFDHQNNSAYKNAPPSKKIFKDYFIFNQKEALQTYLEEKLTPQAKVIFFIHAMMDKNYEWVEGDFSNKKENGRSENEKPAVFFKNEFPDMAIHYLTKGNAWDAIAEYGQRNVYNYGDLRKHFKLGELKPQRVCEFYEHSNPAKRDAGVSAGTNSESFNRLITLLNRFHEVAKTLKSRYSERTTIQINDEYDVQDLLFALLQIDFTDIRKEDASPNHSGSNSRIDLVLRGEQTLLEAKITRKGNSIKKLGEQLAIDITRYQAYPNIKNLVFFIYDKADIMKNKVGFISDFEKVSTPDFQIRVVINPA